MMVSWLTFGVLSMRFKSDVFVYAVEALSWMLPWVCAEPICGSETEVCSWCYPCPDARAGVQGKHQDLPA